MKTALRHRIVLTCRRLEEISISCARFRPLRKPLVDAGGERPAVAVTLLVVEPPAGTDPDADIDIEVVLVALAS